MAHQNDPDENMRRTRREYCSRYRDNHSASGHSAFSSSATRLPYCKPTPTATLYSVSHSHQRLESAVGCWGEAVSEEEAKLCISNLDPRVTAEDLEVLFSELGDLKDYSIHYDMRGNSLGIGEVTYMRKADAVAAMNRYNGVKLDGKQMIIGFVGVSLMTSFDLPPVTVGAAHADSNILLGRCGKRARACGGGGEPNHDDWGMRGSREHQSNRARRVTAEELDTDLDNYWKLPANAS